MALFALLAAAVQPKAPAIPIHELEKLGFVARKPPLAPYQYRGTLGKLALDIRYIRLDDSATPGRIDRRLFNGMVMPSEPTPSGLAIGGEAMVWQSKSSFTLYAASEDINLFVYLKDYRSGKSGGLTRSEALGIERTGRYTLAMAQGRHSDPKAGVDLADWASKGKWTATQDAVGTMSYTRGKERVVVPLASTSVKVGSTWRELPGITFISEDRLYAPQEFLKLVSN